MTRVTKGRDVDHMSIQPRTCLPGIIDVVLGSARVDGDCADREG